jgi:hypothetical protein
MIQALAAGRSPLGLNLGPACSHVRYGPGIKNARRYIALILYYGIASRLPSRGPLNAPSRWARQELCRRFVQELGARVNIDADVHLGTGASV